MDVWMLCERDCATEFKNQWETEQKETNAHRVE